MRLLTSIILLALSKAALAYEGPFQTDGPPRLRVDHNGTLQIFTLDQSVNCYHNKATMVATEVGHDLVASMVLSAQMAGKRIKVWVERYGTDTPQRCKIIYVEVVTD